MRRIILAIRDRLNGAPEGAGVGELRGILDRGRSGFRIRAIRELTRHAGSEVDDLLVTALSHSLPGLRRAAAHGLGYRETPRVLPAILGALENERCDEPKLAMAVAAVRLGLPVSEGWGWLERHAQRRVATWYGEKGLAEALGYGLAETARRWRLALDPLSHGEPDVLCSPQPDLVRQVLRERLNSDPRDLESLEALGAQQHPDDLSFLEQFIERKGGQESHAAVHALGLHGDPRTVRRLSRLLRSLGVDPGHGFQARRAAGLALGRMGDPSVGRVLVRALEDEALEYEGRPGAGLGIQLPVRSTLLYALGESGASDQTSVLVGYLGNTSGSVMGGFYLPAMDALIKLGNSRVLVALVDGPELIAANALGVLGALGETTRLNRALHDPRPRVAKAARLAIQFSSDEDRDVPDVSPS